MKTVTIATHNGVFHADEVFAVAVLKLHLDVLGKQAEVIRTRDVSVHANCDYVVDVGGEYDLATNRFDHHQKEKPGTHENDLPYASFGLIWKHFGRKVAKSKKVWEIIEKKLVMPIDALDNGVSISTPLIDGVHEYGVHQILLSISSTYEDEHGDEAFLYSVDLAMKIITGEIIKATRKIASEKSVTKQIKLQQEPHILILEKYENWELAVSKSKNVKLVVYPDKVSTRWCIQTARDDLNIFGQDRISFPKHWRGLSDQELVEVSGVEESVFCHSGGFFAVATSKVSALFLAQKAIEHDQS